jgi:hypothetical protein
MATPLYHVRVAVIEYWSTPRVENLTAIQHIIYNIDPFLLFTSVTGLLVALVGAATLSK